MLLLFVNKSMLCTAKTYVSVENAVENLAHGLFNVCLLCYSVFLNFKLSLVELSSKKPQKLKQHYSHDTGQQH